MLPLEQNHQQRTPSNEQRKTSNEQRKTSNEQRRTSNEQRTTDNDQRTTNMCFVPECSWISAEMPSLRAYRYPGSYGPNPMSMYNDRLLWSPPKQRKTTSQPVSAGSSRGIVSGVPRARPGLLWGNLRNWKALSNSPISHIIRGPWAKFGKNTLPFRKKTNPLSRNFAGVTASPY